MELRRVVFAGMATALLTGVAVADEKKKGKEPDMQAMMAAYEKAATPGEQHKLLQKQVGKWNLTLKTWQAPDQPPMESTAPPRPSRCWVTATSRPTSART
jgi:hypothetical protein